MGSPTLLDIDVTATTFDALYPELLVGTKTNRVPNSLAAALTRPIAQWANLLDDMGRRMQRRLARREMSIYETGAVGDGVTSDATALQDLIDALDAKGGGVAVIPPPPTAYVLGTPTLRSGVRLHYIASGDPNGSAYGTDGDRYTRLDGTTSEYVKTGGTGNTGWVAAVVGQTLAETLTAGDTVTAGQSINWKDNQGVPITRAIEDYDSGTSTRRTRMYTALGALLTTLSLSAVDGSLAFDGVAKLTAGVVAGAGALTDADARADNIVVGDLASGDTGVSLLLAGEGGTGRYAFTKVAGAIAASFDYVGTANTLSAWVGGVEGLRVDASGNVTLPQPNASLQIGDGTGSPNAYILAAAGQASTYRFQKVDLAASTGDFRLYHDALEVFHGQYYDGVGWLSWIEVHNDADLRVLAEAQGAASIAWGNSGTPANVTHTHHVGANGYAGWEVHDGTNPNDGGVSYNTQFNTLTLRANNADKIYLTPTQYYPASPGGLSSGTTGNRWSGVFSLAGTFTNSIDLDSAAPTLTLGNNSGSPIARFLKSETGDGLFYFYNVDTTPSAGDWIMGHLNNEAFGLGRYDGVDYRLALYSDDDTVLDLLSGAQGTWTIALGNASQGGSIGPASDGRASLGTNALRFLTTHTKSIALGFLSQDTNVSISVNETYLECNSATQVITLPDAAVVGAGHTIVLWVKTAHTSGSLKNASGDTINGNDRSSTGLALNAGFHILVSDGGSDWLLAGTMAIIDTTP